MPLLDIEQSPETLAAREAAAKRANVIFWLSCVSVLFCCIGGIIAAFVANRAQKDVDTGDLDSARKKTNIAMILMILSFVGGLIALVARVALS
jgi:hypothetical protein